MTAHNRWQVFRGKSDQADDLIFNIQEHHMIQLKTKLDVFLAKNTEENDCDFRVKGTWSGISYVVYAVPSNNIIAQVSSFIFFVKTHTNYLPTSKKFLSVRNCLVVITFI